MTPVLWGNYRKDQARTPGTGYGRNVGTTKNPLWKTDRSGVPTSILIHSTNGKRGSLLSGEATFLRDSPKVSCHDIIGKQGSIVEILPPEAQAWHAGVCLPAWSNESSIGIECHHAVGDDWPQPQLEALTWRVKQYISRYNIPATAIETHRAVALPKGRKVDPSDWSDAGFYAWRKELYQPDWAGIWGSDYPYHADWGIATTWRAQHQAGTSLGRALSDEHAFQGGVLQLFNRGIITWKDGVTRIYRGEFS